MLLGLLSVVLVVFFVERPYARLLGAEPEPVSVAAVAPDGDGVPQRRSIDERRLYLVPLDGMPATVVARQARAIARRYPVRVSVLPRMRTERRFVDGSRGQVDAVWLLWHLARAYPIRAHGAAVIGVTDLDVFYSGEPSWAWAFGSLNDKGYGALSTARMGAASNGGPAEDEVTGGRLTRMLLRYSGELYFGLQRDGGTRSVLRPSILGVDDLDATAAVFCPESPTAIRAC